MASYYKIVDGEVKASMVCDADYLANSFKDTSPGTWVTSPRNGTNASIGGTYDKAKDKCIDVQPYPSWVLDSNGVWQCPSDKPHPGKKNYWWDETVGNWTKIGDDYPDE